MQFDFSAFDQKPTFSERAAEKSGGLLWVGLAVGVLFLFFVGVIVVGRSWSNLLPIAIVAIIVCGPIIGLYFDLGHAVKLRRFAAMNGFVYMHDAPFDYRAGVIFGQGHSQKFIDLLRTENRNFAEIGNYQYITGSGKSQQTHRFGFIRMKLPRKLPNMVLDAHSNNTFGRFSNLPESFNRGEKLSLEGDFDKYFTLYAPEQYKIDALYIFTPNMMQALIDTAGSYDCEVIDDDFYIYTQPRFDITNREHFERIMRIISSLQPTITRQSQYYADENVGDRAANIIAPQGARLKSHVSWTVIAFIIAFVLYFGFRIFIELNP